VFCYNEAHVLSQTLTHYLRQGIDLVVVDNGSTDQSLQIIQGFRDNASQYPGRIHDLLSIRTEGYEWIKILRFACEYMHQKLSSYEWILVIDADAFYYSPVKEMTLLEFMGQVQKRGYTIINGKVYEFYPTDQDDLTIDSFSDRMQHYRIVTEWQQHKLFRYHPSVDFYSEAAHIVKRQSPRVWVGREFIYKHYPWTSYAHGLQKIFKDRKERFIEQKDNPRTHRQYLQLMPLKQDLVKDAKKLCLFNPRKAFIGKAAFLLLMRIPLLAHLVNLLATIRVKLSFLQYFHPAFIYDTRYTTAKLLYLEAKKLLTVWKIKKKIPSEIKGELISSLKSIVLSYNDVIHQEPGTTIFPHTYEFLMTNFCNAQCIFCNQCIGPEGRKEITLEKFKVMASNIPRNAAKIFFFSGGGEPLLCGDLFPIIRYVNEEFPWVQVAIRSNGLLIKKYAAELADLHISMLQISVHGDVATNNTMVQRTTTEEIFEGIALLNTHLKRTRKKIYLEFCPTVSKLNIGDLPRLIKKASALRVRRITATFCRYFSHDLDKPGGRLREEDSLFYHQDLYNHTINRCRWTAFWRGIWFRYEPIFTKDFKRRYCFQPWELILVDWDGEVFPCTGGEVWFHDKVDSGAYYFGNLLREHLHRSWNNPTYMRIRRTCSAAYKESFIPECHRCHNTICFEGPQIKEGHILRKPS